MRLELGRLYDCIILSHHLESIDFVIIMSYEGASTESNLLMDRHRLC